MIFFCLKERNHSDCPVTGIPPVSPTEDVETTEAHLTAGIPGATTAVEDETRWKNVVGSILGVLAALALIVALVFIVKKCGECS